MSGAGLCLHVSICTDEDQQSDIEDDTLLLLDELEQLNVVVSVDRPTVGRPPRGTRAGEQFELGGLLVAVVPGATELALAAVKAWVSRRRERAVTVTIGDDSITISNASPGDQDRLLGALLARHAPEEADG